jgi:hypothetical protein
MSQASPFGDLTLFSKMKGVDANPSGSTADVDSGAGR